MIPSSVKEIGNDIRSMKIRGAGLIARTACKGLLESVKHSKAESSNEFYQEILQVAKYLNETRPSAVSLPNGLRFVLKRLKTAQEREDSLSVLKETVVHAAQKFIKNSEAAVEKIGEIGARRIRDGDVLMTICNSSAAISVISTAALQGKSIICYVAETRPRFQGRLTAKALGEAGIEVRLIVDGAIRYFVNQCNRVIVGADSIAANGAVVNKIGTSMLALAAHEARTDLYVAAETYKFSPETLTGHLIEIEERDPSEVISPNILDKMKNVHVRNPAFDFTPPDFVDLIITEQGIIPPQFAITILHEMYGHIEFDDPLL